MKARGEVSNFRRVSARDGYQVPGFLARGGQEQAEITVVVHTYDNLNAEGEEVYVHTGRCEGMKPHELEVQRDDLRRENAVLKSRLAEAERDRARMSRILAEEQTRTARLSAAQLTSPAPPRNSFEGLLSGESTPLSRTEMAMRSIERAGPRMIALNADVFVNDVKVGTATNVRIGAGDAVYVKPEEKAPEPEKPKTRWKALDITKEDE